MRRIGLVILMLAASSGAADASRPMRRHAVDVCVIHGTLKGDSFVYKPFVWEQGKQRDLDLSGFEGLALHIEGYLYPGDRIAVNAIQIEDAPCTP